ncbi:MAG TPA: ergothioneine biosynthesis protein EgtB [Mycobacteriales bacterium]|nr:ergothioneine biosynthesis protein EgtB [Mycobacteriales bacterium]
MTAPATTSVEAALAEARQRTLALTDFDDEVLRTQHSPLMSPLVWDLAHVGNQEELYLLRLLAGHESLLGAEVDDLYDAFRHPRASRPSLPLLSPADARAYAADVRGRALEVLASRSGDPVAEFSAALVAQHEVQHVETMLATHHLRDGEPLLGLGLIPSSPARSLRGQDSVLVPAGPCVIGVSGADEPWSLDNERGAHTVDLPDFRIGRVPVTNAEWQEFIADGGYDDPRHWSPDGWAHRTEAGLRAPLSWRGDGTRVRFGVVEPLRPDDPVQHVCFWEAEAFARWAGARLPTEIEWEKACAWDPALGQRRRWPWGDAAPSSETATLGGTALRPAPAGSLPASASAYGMEQAIGDVWEWTSSHLSPWPGFTPMVYDTYSAPFFGPGYYVLRGGSWATGLPAVRPSFRNWDLPQRRQIFTGVRLAWSC